MEGDNDWIDARLEEALRVAETPRHVFSETLITEYRALLAGDLQQLRKPAELEAMVVRLAAANRPKT